MFSSLFYGKIGVAESEYELTFFNITKQLFFAPLRETNSYFQLATLEN
ncbi:hypothetical protein [Nostoc sp. 'Peltigera membranacea cyanobiont' 213]|nr:hypothetical protein [Nostoc sp. 'Peltigera membranacea cyanobiont' 213]